MNIRLTAFSLIVATSFGLAFNQAAKAQEEGEERQKRGNRFDFAPNYYKLDASALPRAARYAPAIVHGPHAGSAPKNLLGIDPNFVAKAVPPPPPMPAPVVSSSIIPQNTFVQLPNAQLPNDWKSIFGHSNPPTPLIAHSASPLNAPAAKRLHALPAHVTTNGTAKLIHAAKPKAASGTAHALPPIASYGPKGGYQAGSNLPSFGTGSTTSINASVSGRVMTHKH